jgi:Mn2+/Fe2+ NRAMP family transporter
MREPAEVRLVRWQRWAKRFVAAAVAAFLLLMLLSLRDAAMRFFPLVLLAAGAYTGVSGALTYRGAETGFRPLDERPGAARLVGFAWMIVGTLVVLFAASYFFTGVLG